MVEPFEEVVKELGKKYGIGVSPKVTSAMEKLVKRELKELAKNEMLSVKGVRQYFRRVYPKVWYMRKEWRSVSNLIREEAEKRHYEISPKVRLELSRLYSSLTADTLFAAAAYVVLTRGREPKSVTLPDAEKTCTDFLRMPKPTWLC